MDLGKRTKEMDDAPISLHPSDSSDTAGVLAGPEVGPQRDQTKVARDDWTVEV